MATIPSNTRSLTSSPGPRNQQDAPVTEVTQARPPQGVLFVVPGEPEDARITGGTRSLDRRLLALNLSGSHSTPNAA
jgi:hypothetical protein